MHADGIGVDDERAVALAQTHQPVLLLEPTEKQSETDAQTSSEGRNHTPLEEEDANNLPIAGSKVAQCRDIVFLIDNQHRERTHDIETGYDENEGEKDIGNELLDGHNAEGVFLLFEPIEHSIFRSDDFLHAVFHSFDIGSGFEAQFERRDHALKGEKIAGKGDGGEHITLVVFGLTNGEEHAGREQRVGHEARSGIGEVELSFAIGGIHFHESCPSRARAQLLGQSYAGYAVLKVGCAQGKLSVAIEYIADTGELWEVFVYAFDDDHGLLVSINGERMVFYALGAHGHFGHLTYANKEGIVGGCGLSLGGNNFNGWIEGGEERGYQVVKPIEHAQNNDQCHRGYGHSDHGNGTDDVDGVGAFL